MKNLKNKNVAYLPKKEPMYVIHKNAWLQGKRHSIYHPVDGVWPYERVFRLLDSNIGQPFDKVFSKYCDEVPVYQQKFFLEQFEEKYHWRTGIKTDYYVDEKGLIQKLNEEKESKKVTYQSDDYKVQKLHKITKKPYPEWWDFRALKNLREEDYDYFVIKGFEIEFSSKNDPTYKRLISEQKDRKKAQQRQYNKDKEEKINDMINKTYQRLKEEKEAEIEKNKIKIESKGFDYVTSFRTEKQTNPDLIKKDQGFDLFYEKIA